MSELIADNIFRFWAKLPHDEITPNKFHPLICHMLDVAAVTREIWRNVLPIVARERIAKALGLSVEQAEVWVVFLAALHDLGKASPAFQLRDAAEHLLGLYKDMGERPTGIKPSDIPHGRVTAGELPNDLIEKLALKANLAEQLSTIIGGHHGSFPTSLELEKNYPTQGVGGKAWQKVRQELVRILFEFFNVPEILKANQPKQLDHAVSMIIAGLVSVADWMGSDSDFFPYEVANYKDIPKFNIHNYFQRATQQASTALDKLGWLKWSQSEQLFSFEQLFPTIENRRPLQDAVVNLVDRITSPAIAIIEAPMGEGKTEAALFLADRWGLAPGPRGFYIALPTQATSNQMFSRVTNFLSSRYENKLVHLQLLHGHASLSAEFQVLKESKEKEPIQIKSVHSDGECCEGEMNVIAAEWFTHRKRGLLAPFGVGTVDQALLAALQTRHVFVRLFGLSHKTIIIDEVHAYDAYMSKLLERLLEWLAASGSPVVLLSATLPKSKRTALLQAYYRGLHKTKNSFDTSHLEQTYPCISWANHQEINTYSIAVSPEITRTLAIEWVNGQIPQDEEQGFELGKKLQSALADGGCAAVICNTVKRAQDVYKQLKRYFSPEELDLFHAKYLFKDRDEREKRALKHFGKDPETNAISNPKRPFRAVLVATQVVEQSLDLDFDLMVTDIAPIDLILQRSGRLHRHQRPRLPNLTNPTLWICRPEIEGEVPKFDVGSTYVYDEHILLRSVLALAKYPQIQIPSDIEPLIEACYGEVNCPSDASVELQNQWQKTKTELEKELVEMQNSAEQVTIPSPYSAYDILELCNRRLEEDRPDLHPLLQASTRLSEPTVAVVCLLPDQYDQFNWDEKPDLPQTQKLLKHSFTLQHKSLVFQLLGKFDKDVYPTTWATSALLRNYRLLLLDKNACWYDDDGKYQICLDPELGIVINKLS